jgi:predicted membrane-bound spermidine synthase
MTDTQHTPGPWRVFTLHEDAIEIVTDRKTAYETVSIADLRGKPNAQANARLAAAAPAQLLILHLVQQGLMTLEEGEAEFGDVMYWFDHRKPDWCVDVVNAIGWDAALDALAQTAAGVTP